MCGLWGAVKANGAHFVKVGHFMQQGLFMSALRGMQGTGVGVVTADFDTEIAKSFLPSPSFLCSQEWEYIEKDLYQSRVILGHTRASTQGSVNSKNAHPFRFTDQAGNQVMAIHNGHIRNHLSLTPNNFSHQVDSAHATHALLTKGALQTLELLEGAYVLIWFDSRTKTFNMARNTERELYYAMTADKTRLYFGSEIEMLSNILRRNDIPHDNKFYELENHTLYTYDLTKASLVPTLKKYEEKKALPVAYQSGSGGLYASGRRQIGGSIERNFSKAHPEKGDFIWVKIHEPDITLFRPIGDDPETECRPEEAYGYTYGTRSMTVGSIVRVVGVKYTDWKDKWKDIRFSIPCQIVNVSYNNKTEDGRSYVYFEAKIDKDEAEKEWARVSKYMKQDHEKRAKDIGAFVKDAANAEDRRSLPFCNVLAPFEAGSLGATAPRGSDTLGPSQPDGCNGAAVGHGGRDSVVGDGVVLTPDKVPGPKGTKILLREWREIAAQRCYICDGGIGDCDIGQVEWWEHPCNVEDRKPEDIEYQMICPSCKDDPKMVQKLVAA